MSVSRQFLERCSAETGFQPVALEKVVRLGELAAAVTHHPRLGPTLALKGGSALNLCFEAPTRLSVDLDFNYIGQAERGAMLEERPRIEQAAEGLARRLGYMVQRSADAFAGRKMYPRYHSVLGLPDRIEIDLNFLFRVPLVGTSERSMWQPGGIDPPLVRVVSLDELCLGKLLALLDRAAVRDAWDVARLPSLAPGVLRSRSFRPRFLVMSSVLTHALTDYDRKRIEDRVSARAVREQLLPLLVAGQDTNAAELIQTSWAVLEPLLRLGPEEMEFVARLQHGEFRHDLVPSEDPEEVASLERHPAVQWKLRNARSHRGRRTEI